MHRCQRLDYKIITKIKKRDQKEQREEKKGGRWREGGLPSGDRMVYLAPVYREGYVRFLKLLQYQQNQTFSEMESCSMQTAHRWALTQRAAVHFSGVWGGGGNCRQTATLSLITGNAPVLLRWTVSVEEKRRLETELHYSCMVGSTVPYLTGWGPQTRRADFPPDCKPPAEGANRTISPAASRKKALRFPNQTPFSQRLEILSTKTPNRI